MKNRNSGEGAKFPSASERKELISLFPYCLIPFKKAAFTLAEGATHVDMHNNTRKAAFTLAEVLITLGIIGVVAAITLPQFMQDMSERVNSNRQANIAQKITKSVELMIINGDYQGIYDTNQFVDKLSKYLKIAKRCNSAHLDECWPTKKIKTSKGQEYDVNNANTAKSLHLKGNDMATVGLVLADGASIILSFNSEAAAPSAEGGFRAIRKALPVGNGKTKEFAYTSNATNAIDFVMDVNGGTGPNQEADDENFYDIRSFNIASFTNNYLCSKEEKLDGMCVLDLKTKYSGIDCRLSENSKYCNPNVNYSLDYWSGAKKACDDIGMEMPDLGTLINILTNYKDSPRVPKEGVYWTATVTDDSRVYKAVAAVNAGVSIYWRTEYNNVLCVSK